MMEQIIIQRFDLWILNGAISRFNEIFLFEKENSMTLRSTKKNL